MPRRLTVVLALVLSTVLVGGASVALADDEVVVDGTGTLKAAGKGEVVITGSGIVKIKLIGDITITDHAGDAKIWINRHRRSFDSTTITLEDFEGVVKVRGSNFTIDAEGRRIRLVAKGTGTAFFKGRGWYKTNEGRGHWGGGTRVNYEPA